MGLPGWWPLPVEVQLLGIRLGLQAAPPSLPPDRIEPVSAGCGHTMGRALHSGRSPQPPCWPRARGSQERHHCPKRRT